MSILGYAYDADVHCVECAQEAFARFSPMHNITRQHGYGYLETLSDGSTIELDENLIPLDETDSEGNPIHPMFSIEGEEFCHECGDEL